MDENLGKKTAIIWFSFLLSATELTKASRRSERAAHIWNGKGITSSRNQVTIPHF